MRTGTTSAHTAGMTYRFMLIGLLATGACYAGYGQQQQTLPEPVQVAGPPGGQMDPSYYQNPQDPQGYGPGDPSQMDPNDPNMQQDPNAQAPDPQQDAQSTADVDDSEINAALDGSGTWEEDPDYGEVWRPDATLVGADFTPYETCGSWVNTAYGMTFNCDYGWGWLPFHYGRWGWIGNRWGWVRGHQWGPGWVDWRRGGGVVGWRPMGPEGGRYHPMDSHWRFQNENEFGSGHIRGREMTNPGEGLRVTQPVGKAPTFPNRPITHVANVMATRKGAPNLAGRTGGFTPNSRGPNTQAFRQPAYRQPTYRQPNYQPTYRQPTYRPTYTQRPTYAPARPTYQRPSYTQRPTYSRPTYSSPHYSSGGTSSPHYSAPSSSSSHSSSSSSSSHSSGSSSHSSGGGGGGHHR